MIGRRGSVSPLALAVLALLLVACALALVTAQHRARALTVEKLRVSAQAKELEYEGARLTIELGKAAQPAAVAQQAARLGLRPTDGKQTVFLPDVEGAPPLVAMREDKRKSAGATALARSPR